MPYPSHSQLFGTCKVHCPFGMAMPLFHYDVQFDAQDWSEDPDGIELSGIDEMRAEAFSLASGLARDHIARCREIAIRVRNGSPDPVLTLRLSLAVEDRAEA